MAHGWWFENYFSCYHENLESYDGLTKGLVRKFDENHCESLCIKTSNTLHALEGTMQQTPFHISEGDVNMYDDLLEARPPLDDLLEARLPLYEGHSSICDNMEIPLSEED